MISLDYKTAALVAIAILSLLLLYPHRDTLCGVRCDLGNDGADYQMCVDECMGWWDGDIEK